MEFASFTTLVRDEVEKRTGGGYMVRLNDVRKNNGIILRGITLMQDGSNISPTIYLNNYYDAYTNGNMTLVNVVNDVIDTYNQNKVNQNVDMRYFLDFEKVKDKITYKLVNKEKNLDLLADVPHVDYLDLSVVFSCLVATDRRTTATILIHNAHMKLWDKTAQELYGIAMENTQKHLGYVIDDMNSVIGQMIASGEFDGLSKEDIVPEEYTQNPTMYIVTNKNRVDGASCILYPNFLQDFAQTIESGFYVIPSSVHEVIFVPAEDTQACEDIKNMIREINDTQVRQEEILSYSLYYFDRDENFLKKV